MKNCRLRLGWVLGACLFLFSSYAHGQLTKLYPDCAPALACSPKWTWSDGAAWSTLTVPPVPGVPQNGNNAIVLVQSPFTLDVNTANLGLLTIGSGNADLSGMFLQPGSILNATSEGVSDFITYSQTGGTNNAGSFTLTGTYNLQLGTLSATSESINQVNFGTLGNSAGVFTQSDGTTNTVSGTLSLGVTTLAANGLYNLNGGQLSAGNEGVGVGSTGTFEQMAGTNSVSGSLTLGNFLAGDGVYELKGTGTLTAGNEIIGNAGTGVLDQVLGSQTFNAMLGTLTIGAQKNGNGTYILDTAGNDLTAANEVVGDAGTGLFTQGTSGGSDNKITGTLTLGKSAGGTGTYQMSGGTSTLEAQTEIIGAAGSGTFNQKNGTNTVTGDLGIGSTNQGSGTYNLSGGTLKAGTETLGNDPCLFSSCPVPGIINQTGGDNLVGILTLTSGSNYSLSGGNLFATNIVNNGKLDLFGTGVLKTASITVGSSGVMTVSGTSVTLSVGVSTTNNGLIIENGLGNGNKVNWGDFTGNARITIDPATNVFTNLTMLANGVIQAVAGSQFDVSGNFVNLSTQNTLWDTGGAELEFNGSGMQTFDLAGQNGFGFSDNFAWGTLLIDPGVILNLGIGSGDALYVNSLLGLAISGNTITNIDGAQGLFIYYNAADNPSLNGNYNLTGGGELIAAGGPAPTPEPSTLLLFGTGLLGLAGMSLRKKRLA